MHWEGEPGPYDISIPLKVPCVSVVDRAAMLPLNLQRHQLIKHLYPFGEALLSDEGSSWSFAVLVAPGPVFFRELSGPPTFP
jgi:hypothetical protein